MAWTKAIPESRDKLQSRVLVWVVGPALAISCIPGLLNSMHPHEEGGLLCLESVAISLTFGLAVWALRAATPMAALCGSAICFLMTTWTGDTDTTILASGLAPLIALFVLTFAATRVGRLRKIKLGLAEPRRGRSASQVVANLGVAGLIVLGVGFSNIHLAVPGGEAIHFSPFAISCLLLAALCEATADTVSSEIGQAFGGQPLLVTTIRRVPPGTDGAVSIFGTVTGIFAATLVASVGMWSMQLGWHRTLIALTGGIAGLFIDSLLGATVERRGWLGNDLVNFFSTLFAAAVALAFLAVWTPQ